MDEYRGKVRKGLNSVNVTIVDESGLLKFQDDVTIDDPSGLDPDDFGNSETPDVNKTKKRVISYCKQ